MYFIWQNHPIWRGKKIPLDIPLTFSWCVGHVLLIQLFDQAQNSSKPIFYPTLSIQWSNNLILLSGHRPNFNGWSCLTKYWSSFANFDYSFFTIWPSNWCYSSPTPISHHILPIQWLDFGFESRALWTCVVVPTHQEILISHILLT